MAVDTVGGDIELATGKPLCCSRMEVEVANGMPRRVPGKIGTGLLGPKLVRMIDGLLVECLILMRSHGPFLQNDQARDRDAVVT